jgi:uncharacterized membrane protein YidH (DUF202 family)
VVDSTDWSGHDPGVRESLANERNGLAWQRTALSWAASGAAVARYFASDGLLRARTSIGWLMIAVGAVIWFEGARHYHRQATSIRADEPTRVPLRTLQIVWAFTVAVTMAVIAIEVAGL